MPSRKRRGKRSVEKIIIGRLKSNYEIHDNGGTPFKVHVALQNVALTHSAKQLKVHVYKQPNYNKVILTISGVEKVFPGITNMYPGNTLLLKLKGENTYIWIGDEIVRFKPKDEIEKFYTEVGNSDVPYPVAISDTRVYFMLDMAWIYRDIIDPEGTWKNREWLTDAYGAFYDLERNKRKNADIHSMRSKTLVKRQWQ